MPDHDILASGSDFAIRAERHDLLTPGAFVIAAILAGGNAVAVRQGLSELPPFWGASIRFLTAAAILLIAIAVLRRPLPSGRALAGVLIYGILSFGFTYMFLYLAVTQVTAATAMVTLAVVPLLTLGLAVLQRIERFSYRALLGALMAALGMPWFSSTNSARPRRGRSVPFWRGRCAWPSPISWSSNSPESAPWCRTELGWRRGAFCFWHFQQ
ncbi:MAG TPA: DMT family transporter [Anaerolineales bacterium]